MATPILMPALSPTMKEGKVTQWLKKEGDQIAAGDLVAECETDKSNLEIEAYEDGYLIQIVAKEGDTIPVGAPIAYLGEKGEKVAAPRPKVEARSSVPSTEQVRPSTPTAQAPAPKTSPVPRPASEREDAPSSIPSARVVPFHREPEAPSAEERVRISPLAKRIANERGLDVGRLHGSGPNGRIIKRDVEQVMRGSGTSAAVSVAPVSYQRLGSEELPLSSMRRLIAERLAQVKPGVPHFYLTVEVEMDAAMQIRDEAKAVESKVSVNDIVVKAAAIALRRVPRMNVSLQGDRLLQLNDVDVGIAVAIEEGLITPIIRDADQKGLAAIADEARELAEGARKRNLKPEAYNGGSITVSNLGMFGIDSFIAVINPPHAAILAVGAVAERPVVRNGELAVRQMMSVTLSGDHRVIDGALGAQYLAEFKALLEHPMRLLL